MQSKKSWLNRASDFSFLFGEVERVLSSTSCMCAVCNCIMYTLHIVSRIVCSCIFDACIKLEISFFSPFEWS
jgi:hypothetical protein